MADHDPEQDSHIVAHIGHVPENVHLEDIHLHRVRRDIFRRNLKGLAILVALSLLAVGLVLLLSDFWGDFQTYDPGYEPKDQSRQQQMEQLDRAR